MSSEPPTTEDLGIDDPESFNEEQREKLAIDEADVGLDADQEAALEALADTPADRARVELRDGISVEVRTHLSADIEDRLDRIDDHRSNLGQVRADLVACLSYLVVDDQYGDREVWEAFATEYGATALAPMFFRAVEPALDRLTEDETVQKFRAE